MENFIRRENLLLFKKRLAEAHDATTHHVLLKLVAEEEAKDVHLPSKAEPHDAAPNPELANIPRRFWMGMALSIPPVVLEMGGQLAGARTWVDSGAMLSLEIDLAQYVVVWIVETSIS